LSQQIWVRQTGVIFATKMTLHLTYSYLLAQKNIKIFGGGLYMTLVYKEGFILTIQEITSSIILFWIPSLVKFGDTYLCVFIVSRTFSNVWHFLIFTIQRYREKCTVKIRGRCDNNLYFFKSDIVHILFFIELICHRKRVESNAITRFFFSS